MSAERERDRLERVLAEQTGRTYCVLFSRGAAALYCLMKLRASREPGLSVVMPSILCMSPACSALYAGLNIRFADASTKTLQVDVDDVTNLMTDHPDVTAVLVPHLYGVAIDMAGIIEVARERKVLVIEDAAQAQGAVINGRPVGSFGDVSLFSFGHTKIIDAGGGAALLFDDPALDAPLRAAEAGLPESNPRRQLLAAAYSEAYYALAPLYRRDPELGGLYSGFPDVFRDLYVFKGLDEVTSTRILESLERLDDKVKRRRAIAMLYRSGLSHPSIRHMKWGEDDAPWRYSITIDVDDPSGLADAIRSDGVDLSNWYPPLHRMLRPVDRDLPGADWVGRHVFNLWTEPSLSDVQIERVIDTVMRRVVEYGG